MENEIKSEQPTAAPKESPETTQIKEELGIKPENSQAPEEKKFQLTKGIVISGVIVIVIAILGISAIFSIGESSEYQGLIKKVQQQTTEMKIMNEATESASAQLEVGEETVSTTTENSSAQLTTTENSSAESSVSETSNGVIKRTSPPKEPIEEIVPAASEDL
jgi:hypothetical protein